MFNLLAFFVALFAFALFTGLGAPWYLAPAGAHQSGGGSAVSGGAAPRRLVAGAGSQRRGSTLLYRYAMSHPDQVEWFPAVPVADGDGDVDGLRPAVRCPYMSSRSPPGRDLRLGRRW